MALSDVYSQRGTITLAATTSGPKTMSVSHMNSHGGSRGSSRNFRATMFLAWEMFGPDPTASTASTGTGPSMHAASSDAQNSARTVPPCTYPITQWSATGL